MKTILLIGLLFASCNRPVPPPVTPTAVDAEAPESATCVDGAAHLDSLHCQTAAVYLDICRKIQSQAFKDCIARVATCEDANACDK